MSKLLTVGEILQQTLWAHTLGRRYDRLFEQVRTFCMFIGFPRSGHSHIAALLNAHRHVAISHELHALRYVRCGLGRQRLMSLILRREQWFARRGRRWSGYDYNIPDQWQGRYEELRVIGDKKAGGTTLSLMHHPWTLDRLRRIIPQPLRFIFVVRHPWDNIASSALRDPSTVEAAADSYLLHCRGLAQILPRLAPQELMTIRHESFLEQPQAQLEALCGFLGVDAPPDYLQACVAATFASPHRTRDRIAWPDAVNARVREATAEHEFLRGYPF